MRRQSTLIPIAILTAVIATTGMRTGTRRMYPQLTIFRGASLAEPVGVQHCCVQTVTIRGRSGASLSADTLAILYDGLVAATPAQLHISGADSAASTEVAEFFGSSPFPTPSANMISTTRRPELKTVFATATHFSRIYPGANGGPPIWENPVVAPGGANDRFYVLSPPAVKILASLGVRVR